MKIGIMTFWWSEDNYGQLLQCYALQKYLRDKGHDAFLIRYRYDEDIIPTDIKTKFLKALNPMKAYGFLKQKMVYKNKKTNIKKEQESNPRFFESFRNKYIKQYPINYKTWNDLKDNPPNADMYIVGSDQVWNFGNKLVQNYRNIIHAYFLDFGCENTMRISYAASWSVDSLSVDMINEIKPLLKRFDHISVREKKSIELCVQCGYAKAVWVPDPTMLLQAAVYRALYKENNVRKPKNKYVFLYMLNNMHDFDVDLIYKFAKKNNLDVVYITGNGVLDKKDKFFASIPEWLYLLDNAEYVVTNSYHCSVFSIIFHKKFGVVPLIGKFRAMNDRINSLFIQYGIKDRFIRNKKLDILDMLYNPNEIHDNFLKDIL